MKKFDVVTLGELLIDMFPDKVGYKIGEVKAFIPKPGGAPANVAVAVSRLGSTSAFIGKLGQDHFGTYLKNVLDEENVTTTGIRFDPEARTTMAIIAMPDEHTAEFVFYRNPGADQLLTEGDLDVEMLQSTRVLHFCSVSLTDEPVRSATFAAARIARKAGALVSYDVNLVKVNEEEAALLTGVDEIDRTDPVQVERAALKLLDSGPQVVVITLGAEGSYFQTHQGGGYVPPFIVKTVDAVGCGDAFVAALLVKVIEGNDWRDNLSMGKLGEALKYANAVGALTSLKRGAIPAMPTKEDVTKFMKKAAR
jgi:fructokinase